MFDDLSKQQNNQQQENKSAQPVQDVPQQPVVPKEDVSQRIEKLREKGVKQGGRKKLYLIIGIAVILLFTGGVVGAGYFYWDDITNFLSSKDEEGVACRMDAKVCPDGSSVGRVLPDCEFAECPVVEEKDYYQDLEKKCNGSSCCLASLKTMRENNYKEADENYKCPDGFKAGGLRCESSLTWCEPIEKELSNEKFLIIPSEWMDCENNSDCAETQLDCCGCTAGGEQIAINKKYINQWEERIGNACMDITCITVVTCKPGYSSCVNELCEYVEVSEEDCVKEGESYPVTDQPYACCMGSGPISCNAPNEQKECKEDCVEIMYCTACGNGECKEPENICNCPQDCLSQMPECRGLQKEAREECECVALGGWWGSDKCYALTSDAGKFCTDSSECEGECIGVNWEAISGECGKWTVEKGCYYVLLNGKVNFAVGCEGEEADSSNQQTYRNEEQRIDTDSDGLFDDEEAEYGTDINNSDSDGDGYLDGDEVKNGYNPMGEGRL